MTLEMFKLKWGVEPDNAKAYINGIETSKRAYLSNTPISS
jgi:hypothetical protein